MLLPKSAYTLRDSVNSSLCIYIYRLMDIMAPQGLTKVLLSLTPLMWAASRRGYITYPVQCRVYISDGNEGAGQCDMIKTLPRLCCSCLCGIVTGKAGCCE